MNLIKPLSTEKSVKLIESENTIVFLADKKSTKENIKKEFESMFNVKVKKIRTLTRNNKKHVYIKLKEGQAIDIATKLGMM